MKVKELFEKEEFEVISIGEGAEEEISEPYCCDLLSIAMTKLRKDAAWITVMANINTLAVAKLTETACIVLAEGVVLDEVATAKARSERVTVLGTKLSIFEAALFIKEQL